MAALPIDLDRAASTPLATQTRWWPPWLTWESGREDLGGHEEKRGAGALETVVRRDEAPSRPSYRRMNMHCLEHILLVTSVAVENDEISKAELVRVLGSLASLSHDYAPEGDEPADIVKMNDEWHRRFGHLMYGDLDDNRTDPTQRGATPDQ
jgi:hypothetical protein